MQPFFLHLRKMQTVMPTRSFRSDDALRRHVDRRHVRVGRQRNDDSGILSNFVQLVDAASIEDDDPK